MRAIAENEARKQQEAEEKAKHTITLRPGMKPAGADLTGVVDYG